jgi:hypothetical protein
MNAQQEAWPPDWMLDLERAHDRLHRAARALEILADPPWDLRPAAESIEKAIEKVYVAYDQRGDQHRATYDASTEAAEARSRLDALKGGGKIDEAIAHLDDARAALSDAERRLAAVIPREPPMPPPIRASNEVPTLHALMRGPLVPKIRVADPPPPPPELPPPLPPPKTIEELQAMVAEVKRRAEKQREAAAERMRKAFEPAPPKPPPELKPGFVPEIPPPKKPLDWIGEKARECFEEVAMIGLQRMPLLGDPFRSVQFLERRMLCSFDAIAALGPGALAKLEPLAMDSPVKDAPRAFAAGFVFGCFRGRDALGAAERIFRWYGPSVDEIADGFADGLKIATNPLVDVVARAWLNDPDPSMRAVAIEVLGYRRTATAPELVACANDSSPRVAAKALPYLGALNPPQFQAPMHEAIDSALQAFDLSLKDAAWAAMSLSAHPHVSTVLNRALSEEGTADRAAIPLAIVCDGQDAQTLLRKAEEKPTELLLLALGWAGDAACIPFLIKQVGGKKKELKTAAANALDRISGAQLYEEIDIDPEKIEVEDPPEPEIDLDGKKPPKPVPLAKQVSDPRDEPGEGAPDALELPTTDVRRWQEWWSEAKGNYRSGTRYRRGHPYTPTISLWELDGWRVTPFERRMLQRELVVRTGHYVPFDPFDFVPVQEAALKQWEPHARNASGHGGSFTRSMRRG